MIDYAVPWLRDGKGDSPEKGGCIMQILDWITTGGWTDDPPCVHQRIKDWAIAANDGLDAEPRQELLDLLPRMMNTSPFITKGSLRTGKRRYNHALETRLGLRFCSIAESHQKERDECSGFPCTCGETAFQCLKDLLDAYDEIIGRPEPVEEIDLAPVCAVMGVGATADAD